MKQRRIVDSGHSLSRESSIDEGTFPQTFFTCVRMLSVIPYVTHFSLLHFLSHRHFSFRVRIRVSIRFRIVFKFVFCACSLDPRKKKLNRG